jgi:hypothetical protein
VSLWDQFGDCFLRCNSVNARVSINDKKMKRFIWVDVTAAKTATKIILSRALQTHVRETLEAINAFVVIPEVEEQNASILEEDNDDDAHKRVPTRVHVDAKKTPTHIDLYLWLRLMLQQLHAEQIQRKAAVRLMFETASVGALTPLVPVGGRPMSMEDGGHHVEYPQFQSICRTLFKGMATSEIATLYAMCYVTGKKSVTADVFMSICDRKGLFSRFMRLAALPTLIQHYPQELFAKYSNAEGSQGGEGLVEAVKAPKPTISTANKLRVQLGAMIHMKMASITPEIKQLMELVPDKWKGMLVSSFTYMHYHIFMSKYFF